LELFPFWQLGRIGLTYFWTWKGPVNWLGGKDWLENWWYQNFLIRLGLEFLDWLGQKTGKKGFTIYRMNR